MRQPEEPVRNLLLLQHQGAFLADRGRDLLRKLGQQPRQCDLEPHVVLGDVDQAGGVLADRAHVECDPVAGPGFLVDGEQGGIVVAYGREAGLDPAHGLLATEGVRDGDDEWLRHVRPPRFCGFGWAKPLCRDGAELRQPSLLRRGVDCAESRPTRRWAMDCPRNARHNNPTRSASMRLKASLYLSVAAIGLAGFLAFGPVHLNAQTAVAIDNDDIGGVVTGASGPEAGVWVVAETTDL